MDIIAGRRAVEEYREAHRQLHSEEWTPDIPERHTPLLNTLMGKMNTLGFQTLEEFFTASHGVGDDWK